MGYERIVIPLDGSVLAEVAVQHVVKVASPGAQIKLISVVTNPVGEMVSLTPEIALPDALPELRNRETYLNEVADPLRGNGYEVTVEVHTGRVVDNIAEATREGCDLVIIATHRRNGFSRFILGSVSQSLLHETHCPILIV